MTDTLEKEFIESVEQAMSDIQQSREALDKIEVNIKDLLEGIKDDYIRRLCKALYDYGEHCGASNSYC